MILVIIIEVLALLIAIIVLACYVNSQIKLKREGELFLPIGKKVDVNNHKMNVYTEGEGKITLVFMAGGFTPSPVLDFRSLYSILSDTYSIAVVEKSGYGFSDITNNPRDIDSMLEETREALFTAGNKPPFILCPHSMSALEALYWSQKYPKEVRGIIGLDPAIPQCYENFKMPSGLSMKIASYLYKIGFLRLIPSIVDKSSVIEAGCLSDEEKEIFKTIFYRRSFTKDMINEANECLRNAIKVNDGPSIKVPMLIFISNGIGTGWDTDNWRKILTHFAKKESNRKVINLYCGHYVHNYEYNKIAMYSKIFIEETIL